MKVKAIDIARTLGISKATVSLALNNKPGVSEQTRQEIFDCKKMLEENRAAGLTAISPEKKKLGTIKVVRVCNGMKSIRGAELDLWTDVNRVFEKSLKAEGYSLGLVYVDLEEEDSSKMIAECNQEDVAGVIMFGSELKEENTDLLKEIDKPMVIYDAVPNTNDYPVVVIDNRQGVELAVDELLSKGNSDILYLANTMPMYNFLSRQRGFLEVMKKKGMGDATDRIIPTSDSIEGVKNFMIDYLKNNKLPQAYILEDYHVSIGTISAMLSLGIKIPEEVSLIGIDALPGYLTGGITMTSVRVPHTERAYWAVEMLLKEIRRPAKEKCRVYTNCVLKPGDTVKAIEG